MVWNGILVYRMITLIENYGTEKYCKIFAYYATTNNN